MFNRSKPQGAPDSDDGRPMDDEEGAVPGVLPDHSATGAASLAPTLRFDGSRTPADALSPRITGTRRSAHDDEGTK